jgi:hypothetical protein
MNQIDRTAPFWDEYFKDVDPKGNVCWIICNTVDDCNYKTHFKTLTNEELIYCIELENRKSSKLKLLAEAKKRGVICKSCGHNDYRIRYFGHHFVKPGLCSQCAEVGKE